MKFIYSKLIFYDPCPLWRGHTIYAWSHHKKQTVYTNYKHDFQIWTIKQQENDKKNKKNIRKINKKSQAHTFQNAFLI